MHKLIGSLVLVALTGACRADTFEPALRLALPDKVAGMSLVLSTRSVQTEKGANYGWLRDDSEHTSGFVTVNVRGAEPIPDGIESPAIRGEFGERIAKIERELPNGRGPDLIGPSEPRRTAYPGCGPQFLWTAYTSESDEGVKVWSVYLLAMNSHFVEVATGYLADDETGREVADRFVQEMRKVLGHCR
jgi:hypothetical protein